jgi:gliding motility-associated-like protein
MVLLMGLVTAAKAQYIEFIENKGQWDGVLTFKGDVTNGAFALTKNGYRVLRHNPAEHQQMVESRHNHKLANRNITGTVHSHAWFVNFEGASPDVTITPEKPQPGVSNYYLGNDPQKWASGCRSYTSIQYANLYPGVDVHYYTDNGVLKYDMMVKPGGSVNNIRLKYEGVDGLSVNAKGELVIATSVGAFTELSPYTYQIVNNTKRVVKCEYKIEGNTVRFKTGDYDKSQPLVIDPTLIFSSYSGSTGDNWGFTATPGPDGSFFGGGIALQSGFPVSAGAFQTGFVGGNGTLGCDIAIMKLSANGANRLYATYIGGNRDEQPHSIICDPQGNLVIAGRTESTNYPATTNFGPGGGFDIVISKLNATGGGLIGSMRIGGSGDDGVNIEPDRAGRNSLQYHYGDDGRSEVTLDAAGNVIVAACTRSSNFFTTPAAIQTTLNGQQDAVFIKCNPNLSAVLFSTYYGGNGDDAAYVVSINPADGDLYFAGGTASNDLTGNTAGVLQANNAGGIDGFLAVVAPDGSSVKKLSYFGTQQHDQVFGVQFDRNNFPYVMGISLGNWAPVNAIFQQAGSHQFVGKLKKDLSAWEYTTKFGTNSSLTNLSPVSFLVDNCENVYVTGWTGDVAGNYPSAIDNNQMTTTPDRFPHAADGNDFYYIVIEKDAKSQLFGSFFGDPTRDDHVDGGTSRFDPQGVIYQAACAGCINSDNFTTTAGAWSRTNNSDNCNMGMTKIRFNYNGVDAQLGASPVSGCVPLTVTFSDSIANAVTYQFDFFDGSPTVIQNTSAITHTFLTPGLYNVRLIASDPNTCNLRDTSFKLIRVRGDRASVGFNGVKQPPCENLTYRFTNTSVAPAGKPFKDSSFVWDFGDGSPRIFANTAAQTKTYAAPGTYTVRLLLRDTNYCNAPDSVEQVFRLSPTVEARFNVEGGCSPINVRFENTSLAGASFIWDFGDGSATSTDVNPTHSYALPGTYTVTLVANDPNTCNLTSTVTDTIRIHPTPEANFTYSPQPVRSNTPTQFTNLSTGATTYLWKFGDGETSTEVNPLYQFLKTDTFNVCLLVTNQFGCTDSICDDVPALVEQLLDVPNALTPNGDGKNDKIYVRGFGIRSMTWRIFNRYGQIVFQTTNRNEGWDGTYKGVLQPMEVYAYTLEADMSDGQRVRKQGDITLIR